MRGPHGPRLVEAQMAHPAAEEAGGTNPAETSTNSTVRGDEEVLDTTHSLGNNGNGGA